MEDPVTDHIMWCNQITEAIDVFNRYFPGQELSTGGIYLTSELELHAMTATALVKGIRLVWSEDEGLERLYKFQRIHSVPAHA
jgi:hypothetical protein